MNGYTRTRATLKRYAYPEDEAVHAAFQKHSSQKVVTDGGHNQEDTSEAESEGATANSEAAKR